jgi:hypothetical protein
MPDALDAHYNSVIKAITDGRVVPFFGAGVNLVGRPKNTRWQHGQYLPSGGELATYLADSFRYPDNDKWDLLRVSQYIAVMEGSGPLYEELRKLFDADYPSTAIHQFFAKIPSVLRSKGYPPRYQLIVTTNYDDVMERAFREANEPFDLVTFIAGGEHRGKFMHLPFNGDKNILIEKPNEYRGLALDQRSVVLKIHGAIDRLDPDADSYVITEDDYIDYLTRTEVSSLVPITLAAKLKKSNFLFLGYGLRDWNLRVILHRIWGQQKLTYKSWAIQLSPSDIEKQFWRKRDVDIIGVNLEDYIAGLNVCIQALHPFGAAL